MHPCKKMKMNQVIVALKVISPNIPVTLPILESRLQMIHLSSDDNGTKKQTFTRHTSLQNVTFWDLFSVNSFSTLCITNMSFRISLTNFATFQTNKKNSFVLIEKIKLLNKTTSGARICLTRIMIRIFLLDFCFVLLEWIRKQQWIQSKKWATKVSILLIVFQNKWKNRKIRFD